MSNLTQIIENLQSTLTEIMTEKITSVAHDGTLDPTGSLRNIYTMRKAFSKLESLLEMLNEGYPEDEVLNNIVEQAHDCVRTILHQYPKEPTFESRVEASAVSMLYIRLTAKFPHLRSKDPVGDLITSIKI